MRLFDLNQMCKIKKHPSDLPKMSIGFSIFQTEKRTFKIPSNLILNIFNLFILEKQISTNMNFSKILVPLKYCQQNSKIVLECEIKFF